MSVVPAVQGLGVGRKLAMAAIEQVKALGETHLYLETNTKLNAAVHLYRALGFVEQPFPDGYSSNYKRANMRMELVF